MVKLRFGALELCGFIMKRINLLSWREQRHQKQKRQFLYALSVSLGGVLLIIIAAHIFLSSRIDSLIIENKNLKSKLQLLQNETQTKNNLNNKNTINPPKELE